MVRLQVNGLQVQPNGDIQHAFKGMAIKVTVGGGESMSKVSQKRQLAAHISSNYPCVSLYCPQIIFMLFVSTGSLFLRPDVRRRNSSDSKNPTLLTMGILVISLKIWNALEMACAPFVQHCLVSFTLTQSTGWVSADFGPLYFLRSLCGKHIACERIPNPNPYFLFVYPLYLLGPLVVCLRTPAPKNDLLV